MDKVTRIAIIEDNQIIRDNLYKFISMHEEFELVTVVNSIEAFQKAPKESLDVMLLDIGLPGLSGIEGIPIIKREYPDLDIMILTTYEEEDVIVKALCNGACSYLSKKTSLKDIVNAIRIVVNGGSYMSPSIAREIVQYLMGGQVSKATILSSRQREVLKCLVDGKSYQTIADELFLSIETIRTHVKKMYKVLQVNSKTEAIALYLKGEIK